jgi:hypothetical protein
MPFSVRAPSLGSNNIRIGYFHYVLATVSSSPSSRNELERGSILAEECVFLCRGYSLYPPVVAFLGRCQPYARLRGWPQVVAVVCPSCRHTIQGTGALGSEAVLEAHQRVCNPRRPKAKKARCPVKGCRDVLGPVNHAACESCHMTVGEPDLVPKHHTPLSAIASSRDDPRNPATGSSLGRPSNRMNPDVCLTGVLAPPLPGHA